MSFLLQVSAHKAEKQGRKYWESEAFYVITEVSVGQRKQDTRAHNGAQLSDGLSIFCWTFETDAHVVQSVAVDHNPRSKK